MSELAPPGSSGSGETGNTNQSPLPKIKENKRGAPAIRWEFVWNNYPDDWRSHFGSTDKRWRLFVMQQEIGPEYGTPHIQGCLYLYTKKRWSNLGLPKQVSFRAVRDWNALTAYCMKEDTRAPGTLPWVKGIRIPRPLPLITPDRPWQQEILAIVSNPPDHRKIYWYWEPRGNCGKSAMGLYLGFHFNAVPLTGKKNDILHAVCEYDSDVYLYDLPRSRDGKQLLSYETLETVKNGFFLSGKYESKPVMRAPPHIIVFANIAPDQSRMSADRWVIKEILPDFTTRVTEFTEFPDGY